jgi:excisionase family DNA binding protein
MEQQKLITRTDLAAILNCSPGTVYKMTRGGDIPHIRIGTDLRYDPQEVISTLKAKSQTAGNAKPHSNRY